jgi:hypothetical protein
MNNDEAKFMLQGYRPGGRDAGDPAMMAALEQARRDPALAGWFQREQAHGAAVAAKLREIAPPPGLRAAILAGARVSGRADPVRPAWRHPAWLALAAGFALLLGLAGWWRFAPVGGASFEEYAMNVVDRGFVLGKRGDDLAELKSWLAGQRGPLPGVLPAEFAALRALGCRTLEYRGRDVSLVCFERGKREFHVFVARREDLPPGEDSPPRFLARGDLVAATWTDARNRYVVVSDANMDTLKRLL